MRTPTHTPMQYLIFAVVAVGLFHIARPLAVSAQSGATVRVEATVVPATAAWAAHRLAGAAIRPDRGSTLDRLEASGMVLWREDDPANPTVTIVTVAHLGS